MAGAPLLPSVHAEPPARVVAWERITPYCACGYQLLLLEFVGQPTMEPVNCSCSRCGRVVPVRLWRQVNDV